MQLQSLLLARSLAKRHHAGARELAPAWRGRRHAFSLPSVAALPAEGEGNASETDVAGVVVTARPIGAAVAVAATGAGGGCGRFDLLAVRRERVPAGAEVVQALSCGLAGVLRSTSTTSGASRPTAARARAFAAIAMPFGPAPMTVRQCHRSLNIATMPELFCGSVSSTSALISSFCACDTSASAPAPIPAPTAALASRAGGKISPTTAPPTAPQTAPLAVSWKSSSTWIFPSARRLTRSSPSTLIVSSLARSLMLSQSPFVAFGSS